MNKRILNDWRHSSYRYSEHIINFLFLRFLHHKINKSMSFEGISSAMKHI